jgi:hypothetical protein
MAARPPAHISCSGLGLSVNPQGALTLTHATHSLRHEDLEQLSGLVLQNIM